MSIHVNKIKKVKSQEGAAALAQKEGVSISTSKNGNIVILDGEWTLTFRNEKLQYFDFRQKK